MRRFVVTPVKKVLFAALAVVLLAVLAVAGYGVYLVGRLDTRRFTCRPPTTWHGAFSQNLITCRPRGRSDSIS